MNRKWLVEAAALVLLSVVSPAAGLGDSSNVAHNTLGNRIGANSYDPVSYFPEGGGTPARGLIKITAEYDGVVYRFRNAANQAKFKANPAKFAPAYHGWCAWAVAAMNTKVDTDPSSYEIRNGRLFLFYRDAELDTRELWLKDAEKLFRAAEENWKKGGLK
jgi:hypothetical protein